jgi:hypothetical protein
MRTPSLAASIPAEATVFGMSWNLRSRKLFAETSDAPDDLGTCSRKELLAHLEHPSEPAKLVDKSQSFFRARYIQSYNQRIPSSLVDSIVAVDVFSISGPDSSNYLSDVLYSVFQAIFLAPSTIFIDADGS